MIQEEDLVEEEEGGYQGNFFDGLEEEEELNEEEKKYQELVEHPPPALPIPHLPPQSPYQSISDVPDIDRLTQQVASYRSVLEEKKERIKTLLLERDKLVEKSLKAEIYEEELVRSMVKIEELEEKLSRRKAKYREKLEIADKYLAEREQIRKSEIFSQHLQVECQGKLAKVGGVFEQNKLLSGENKQLRQLLQDTQKNCENEIKSLRTQLTSANHELAKESKGQKAYKASVSQEIEGLKQSLVASKQREVSLSEQLALYQSRNWEHLSMETCQELLAMHLDTAKNIQKAIQRKSEANQCVVCLHGARKVLLLPCAHLILCGECGMKVTCCPICRAGIGNRVRVLGD